LAAAAEGIPRWADQLANSVSGFGDAEDEYAVRAEVAGTMSAERPAKPKRR
jgi:hypothetical protein